jgi:transcriptional regulator with PAS, ATPase and Fis domain
MNYSLVSKELKEKFGNNIIGKSKEIKNVLNLMAKVAKAGNTSVLITGESGTGKELVARGIHSLSVRKDHYFYAVNCSAVPENLFESSFFGHKKGAFTGANEDKKGWFEIASSGTLFLDEIGDMPAAQQSKFLRVLEEKKIRKVGSHIEIPVDVRIIAATNKDAKKLVANNILRSDLYHRLSSFEIHIPPLRERIEKMHWKN